MSNAEEPEEKFKTLINIGVGFSILLIIGIFITIGVTKAKLAEQPDMEALYQAHLDSMITIPVDDYDYYDDPGTYYDTPPLTLEAENDSIREVIRNSYTSSYKEKLLDHLETETDKCVKLIRDITEDLGDTMSQPGVSGPMVSIDFFDRTQRDEELFSALFAYRETCEDLAPDAGIYDVVVYRDYFPLREYSAYGYIKSWDESNFRNDPVDVMNYLKNLELDLRHYENQLLWDMLP